jgi:RimJ/RimL family protein N-acetyltransferase
MQLALERCIIRPWRLDDAESLVRHANNRKIWLAVRDLFPHPTVGYWLGEKFWGRGIMTEVVTAVTDFCFDNFPFRRISAEVFANNPASARVLEKAGFTLEGRLKNHILKDGEVLDSLLYARTK